MITLVLMLITTATEGGTTMSRLIGKQPNYTLWVIPLLALAALATIINLEYTGNVDVVPQFGRDRQEKSI